MCLQVELQSYVTKMRATRMNEELNRFLFGIYHILLNFFLISDQSSLGLQELQFPRFLLTFLVYSFSLLIWPCQFFEKNTFLYFHSLVFFSYNCTCFSHDSVIWINCLVTGSAFRENKLRNIFFSNSFYCVKALLPLNRTMALISFLPF